MHEPPKAFYRLGDRIESFQKRKLEPHEDTEGYRSLHYIIKDACLAEIQVRTVFEEGWCEIDHHFRYGPAKTHSKDHPVYSPYLDVFNHLARTADEMGTVLLKIRKQFGHRAIFGGQIVGVLKAKIGKLNVDANLRQELLNHVESLEQSLKFTGKEGTLPLGYLWITRGTFPTQLNWTTPTLQELDPLLDNSPDDI